MQISIIKKSDILQANRFDAEYFQPDILDLISTIENSPFTKIGKEFDVTKLAGFEYTKYFTEKNMRSKNTYPALTSLNIQNENLIEEGSQKIDKDIADNFLSRSKLFFGDVILSYTGEYRRSLTILKDGFQLGPNICLIRNKTGTINSFYLSTYLNSKIGQTLLDREKTVSGQPTVAMSRIRKISIPLFNEKFQKNIEDKILNSKQKQNQSKKLYKESEQILLQELGLLNFKPQHKLFFETTKKEINEAKRFDAEYFQQKYKEIIKKIETYKGGFTNLGDKNFAELKRGSLVPDKFYTEEKGIGYIRGADFSNGILTNQKLIYISEDFIKNTETQVFENDIVFSLIGSVGASAFVAKDFDNFFISNNTGKISLKTDFNSIVLQIFLQSIAGQMQFEKEKMQTAQPKISTNEIEKIKIPLISQKIQNQIAEKIKKSHRLRKESQALLEEAKSKVEQEIEKEYQKR